MIKQIKLNRVGPSVLACGAWFKNTVCLSYRDTVYFSPLIGDLDQADARIQLVDAVAELCALTGIQPDCVVHDLHPDFYSSLYARQFAAEHHIPCVAVQHHVAHIAAVCAEHGVDQPVLGLALDGVGLGADGLPWGGELLKVSPCAFERLGHLSLLPMPGGDKAAQEPWRMASAALFQLGRGASIKDYFADRPAALRIENMLQRQLNSPKTSSMGRLFDAAAGLLKINLIQEFEAQAAILLQQQAEKFGPCAPLVDGFVISNDGLLDFTPLLAYLVDHKNTQQAAAVFHATLVAGLTAWVLQQADRQQIKIVALGGGCFHNAILHLGLTTSLAAAGLTVIYGQQLPPNDMSICLGQLWYAQNLLLEGTLCV